MLVLKANHGHDYIAYRAGNSSFREDECRVCDPMAGGNFALLRKVAISLLVRDRSNKTSLRGRCRKVAWDNDYMRQLF
ncbi:hypothetical protein [Nitrosococcus oceani]|uniref:hypothetical protein n=1 Tax=Nitrosococcus oceani TaxID=1229 RepID=UPI000A61ED5E|nr:hypothetical protein [Nitrosococcus oceani]